MTKLSLRVPAGLATIAAAIPAATMAQNCEWSALGGFTTLGTIHSMEVYGGHLHIGGHVDTIGGIPVGGVARWDGQSWSSLGGGPNGYVYAMLEHGGFLYAGGAFRPSSGGAGERIARWDGNAWSPVGTGIDAEFAFISAMAVYQGELHVGGEFDSAGGVMMSSVARWDGAQWRPLGSGISGAVRALAVFDDGSGPSLFAGGNFLEAGGVPVERIARWDGEIWWPAGYGMNEAVMSLAVHDDGTGAGPSLYAGGYFVQAGSLVAKWNSQGWWEPVGEGLTGDVYPAVHALAVYNDGTGEKLYAGGSFDRSGSTTTKAIAVWDGAAWGPVGGGMQDLFVYALAPAQDGIYAGGNFVFAGGVKWAHRVARWSCEAPQPTCPANCDGSTTQPILNVDDFTCFINEFAASQGLPHQQQVESYANCDGSTTSPALNVDDFTCFINQFAAGCP